jgi:hypothetical protein
MKWFLLAAIVVALAARFGRLRQRRVAVFPSHPVSTLHVDMSKKQSKQTQAALDAASSTLR